MSGGEDGYVAHRAVQRSLSIVLTMRRQALHRGQADRQDRLHLRVLVHRLWYLREEVSSLLILRCLPVPTMVGSDAHLKPSLSLISPPILSLKLRIVTPRMHSSSIVCPHHDRAKFLVLSAPTVLARVQPSKSSQESSSPTSAVTMFVHPHLPAHPAKFSLPCRIHQIGKKY